MADYRVYWAPILDPLTITGELPLTGFTYTDTLNSPGEISGTIPLNPYPAIDPGAAAWTMDTFGEGRTALWVARDDVPVWTGVLWGYDPDLAGDRLTFHGEGWHSAIRKFEFVGAYVDTEQVTIVRDILTVADNAFLDPGLGPGPAIIQPTTATGVLRTIDWGSFNPVACGEGLERLAGLADGFDFMYRPYDGSGTWRIEFDLIHPAAGTDTGLVFELGGNIMDAQIRTNGKNLAMFAATFGNGSGAETLFSQAINGTFEDQGYPPYLTLDSAPDVADQDYLNQFTNRLLARSAAPVRMIDLTLDPGGAPGIGDYRVGDNVTVIIDRGFVQIDDTYRIVSKSVQVDNNGMEQVQLSLSPTVLFG